MIEMTREDVKAVAARALQSDSRQDLLDALALVLDTIEDINLTEAS